jgi:hypothetical protein
VKHTLCSIHLVGLVPVGPPRRHWRVRTAAATACGDWVTNLVVDPYKESRGRWLSRTGPNTQGDARLSSVAHIHPITQTTPVVPDDTGDYCALRMTKASVFSS